MGRSGKVVGIILIAFGVLVCVLAAVLLGTQLVSQETSVSGAILGLLLVFLVLVAPSVGAGGYLFVRGRQESAELAEVEKERKLLNIVLTRGQVSIADLVLELQSTRDQVKAWIYDLVGKGLFSGYINWNEGILYSRQAGEMRASRKCPNCGAELEFAGKGVITCPYCGSELFLAS